MPGKSVSPAEELELYSLYLELGPKWSEIGRRANRHPSTVQRTALSHDWESRRRTQHRKDMKAVDIDVGEERRARLRALREIVQTAEQEIIDNGLGLHPEQRLSGYLAALKVYAGILGIEPSKPQVQVNASGPVQVNVGAIAKALDAVCTPEQLDEIEAKLLESGTTTGDPATEGEA